jgi:hypothetical protein
MKGAATLAVFALACSFAGPAAAGDPVDQATATELFNVGRDLMKDGQFAAACPKLTESARLQPTVGALAKLAECEEHEHRMVSAYGRWQQALNLARGTNDDRLADVQHELARVDTLVPKLRITSVVPLPPDASIHVDAVALGQGSLDVALPVDAGLHTIEVSAPGRRSWSTTLEAPSGGATVAITVPALEALTPVPLPLASPTHGLPGAPPTDTPAPRSHPTAWRTIGLVTAGAGLATVAAGGAFGLVAMHQRDQAGCTNNVCVGEGSADMLRSAKSSADVATVLLIAGGALALGGASLWWLAREPNPSTAGITLSPFGAAGAF